MSYIKQAWVNEELNTDLYSISIESSSPGDHNKINIVEISFPNTPTPKHPLRHSINIGLLSFQDLQLLYTVIGKEIMRA